MKKFGTPTAAGPGWASEKVGLLGAGGAWAAGGGAPASSLAFLSFLSCLAGLSALSFLAFLEPLSEARGFEVFLPVVACRVCLPPVGSAEPVDVFFGLAVVVGCDDFAGDWLGEAACFCGAVDGLGLAGAGCGLPPGAGAAG